MKNKGFSLMELMVMIAIVALLTGALTPALIRYVNKARISHDMNTGCELAHAIMEALTDESLLSSAKTHTTPYSVDDMDDSDFKRKVYESLSVNQLVGIAKKDMAGNPVPNKVFYYTLDKEKNKVEVYYGDTTSDYQIYPIIGNKWSE